MALNGSLISDFFPLFRVFINKISKTLASIHGKCRVFLVNKKKILSTNNESSLNFVWFGDKLKQTYRDY